MKFVCVAKTICTMVIGLCKRYIGSRILLYLTDADASEKIRLKAEKENTMKKSFAIMTILCVVMAVVLVGCTPENPPIVNKLTSLSIDSSSAKTVYEEGEAFSTAGLIVKAVYDNGEEKVVTDYTVAPSDALGVTDTFVVMS